MSSHPNAQNLSLSLLDVVWRALPCATEVESVADGPQGLTTFHARVHTSPTSTHLDWHEQGTTVFRGRAFNASNAYRFTRAEASVAVAHLRLGPQAPVHLVDLHPQADTLLSASPHLCGHDLYSLRLTLAPRQLTLHWHIESPQGPTRITALYSLLSVP